MPTSLSPHALAVLGVLSLQNSLHGMVWLTVSPAHSRRLRADGALLAERSAGGLQLGLRCVRAGDDIAPPGVPAHVPHRWLPQECMKLAVCTIVLLFLSHRGQRGAVGGAAGARGVPAPARKAKVTPMHVRVAPRRHGSFDGSDTSAGDDAWNGRAHADISPGDEARAAEHAGAAAGAGWSLSLTDLIIEAYPMGVPAAIYFTQNILIFVSLKHLDSAVVVVLQQMKIISCGIFSSAGGARLHVHACSSSARRC
jgi:hypothetical protein